MFLRWKEDEAEDSGRKLDKYLLKMCRKDRLIELLHDFVLFDGGIKKLPRVHQYFGIKEAQVRILENLGGIIWHTQGSGKSIVMVLLAKWILDSTRKMFSAHFDATFVATNTGQLASKAGKPG